MIDADVEINDKYTRESGRVFISGTQALVRLPLMQRQRDLANGHNTAGYISGYRGSPLGTYDSELWKAKSFLKEKHIHFAPGVNEDLAATAVWGTQQTHTFPDAKYDGVFSIWYGKGPGVDRAGDPLKHANLAGTAPLGGVLLVFGDDHAGKSSTVAHQSEQALAAHSIPVLYPATIQDYIDFGLSGWALSRFSGLWIGLKCVNETVENTASVDIDESRSRVEIPSGVVFPPEGVNFSTVSQTQLAPADDEKRLVRFKLPLVHAFVRANKIDRVIFSGPNARFGIVAAGKSYLDVLQAFRLLGLSDSSARDIGIALYKPGLVWPLEPLGLKSFAKGLEELLFVEEKRPFIEDQAARLLYDSPSGERPRISGKSDPSGRRLLPSDYILEPQEIARVIAARLRECGMPTAEIDLRFASLERKTSLKLSLVTVAKPRTPYFCSGCPHNSSTNLPDGSLAIGGIGCHGMGIFMGRTLRSAHMGGEGLTWTGIAPFTNTKHIFQNLGDGTYSHSGILAIHGAVTSKANITYKILFNDAVAMTGGQPVEGGGLLTVQAITQQMRALGVAVIKVVTDQPKKYGDAKAFASDVSIHDRGELDSVQRDLRKVEGTSVLIYDQTCAAEKRRRRKRGTLDDPPVRAFINDAVCEGCGDCSVKSNCVSVEPLETELGRKRVIDQASCNKDMSCINGFCPSFVTVNGGKLRRPKVTEVTTADLTNLAAPLPARTSDIFNMLIGGVGGTGVVTIGAILGMAAHLEGKGASVFDMTGMAQKGGAVFSHLKIASNPNDIHAVTLGENEADLLLGCDALVAGSVDGLRRIRREYTHVIMNTHLVPTGAFQRDPNINFQIDQTCKVVAQAAGADHTFAIDATALALAFTGNALSANMILVGCAYQRGALPLSHASIEKAIELNGTSIEQTKRSFALGRLFASDPTRFKPGSNVDREIFTKIGLSEFIERRVADLSAYQNDAYARRYKELVETVSATERAVSSPGTKSLTLTTEVAKSYFKLLAYKDEYEVARLYSNGDFKQKLAEQFEGNFKLTLHLAPPIFAKHDPVTGAPLKRRFGQSTFLLFKMLAPLKVLRGTSLDIFGYSSERRRERSLVTEYEKTISMLLGNLRKDNISQAVLIAALPLEIRGYGHVKLKNIDSVKRRESEMLEAFLAPPIVERSHAEV